MTRKLTEITNCIQKELKDFEEIFASCFSADNSSLDNMLKYVVSLKGKRIRPIITFLCALSFGKITKQTFRSAIIVELLHTASLLHDDVIDQSSVRRGKKTLNARFDNHLAILVGDYLYGKALSLLQTQEDFNLMPIFGKIAMDLPQGEIREDEATNKKDTSIDFYLKVIYEKTASLIEASVLCGACSCEKDNETKINLQQIKELGKAIGMAFQIKDDILDYKDNTGKEKGIDIKEGKITIPLIYYIESVSEEEKEEILSMLYSPNKTEVMIKDLLQKVSDSGAIDRAEQTMISFSKQALNIINTFPKNIYSKSLGELVQYLTKRDK